MADCATMIPSTFPKTPLHTSDSVKYVSGTLFVFIVGSAILYDLMFYYYRNQGKFLRVRSYYAILLSSLSLVAFSVGTLFPQWKNDLDVISCDVNLILSMLVVPLMTVPILSRLLTFWNAHVFHEQLSQMNVDQIVSKGGSTLGIASGLGLLRKASKQALMRTFSKEKMKSAGVAPFMASTEEGEFELQDVDDLEKGQNRYSTATSGKSRYSGFQFRKFLSSRIAAAMLTLAFLFPFLFIAVSLLFSEPYYRAGCFGCRLNAAQNIVNASILGVVVFVGLGACIYMRKIDDPFWVLKEISIIFGVGGSILLLGYVLAIFFPNNPKMLFVQALGLIFMWGPSCPWLLVVAKARMRRRGLITDRKRGTVVKIELKHGIENDFVKKAYEKWLVGEMGIESLRFWIDAGKFAEDARDMTIKSRNVRAMKIARVYIGAGAVMPINISAKMVKEIALQLPQNESDNVSAEIFDSAIEEIYNIMQRGSWSRFTRSNAYQKAVAESENPSSPSKRKLLGTPRIFGKSNAS